ncbi:MAG: hypothetical protein EA381_17080 [Planctomycetaceae bacterium]|nr:MAG: hypothetical protein EA381_17080 [Planctomycetaceae bacterium]
MLKSRFRNDAFCIFSELFDRLNASVVRGIHVRRITDTAPTTQAGFIGADEGIRREFYRSWISAWRMPDRGGAFIRFVSRCEWDDSRWRRGNRPYQLLSVSWWDSLSQIIHRPIASSTPTARGPRWLRP